MERTQTFEEIFSLYYPGGCSETSHVQENNI